MIYCNSMCVKAAPKASTKRMVLLNLLCEIYEK